MKTDEINKEMYEGTKRRIFVVSFPELPQTVAQWMYIVVGWWSREWLTLSVLLYSTFTVQILYELYSLQLNCTYSNYKEAAATCSAAQQERNSTSVVVWSAVQPVVWYCMYIERQSHPVIRSFKEIQMTKQCRYLFKETLLC
jgi:hypothetical protein